MFLEATKDTTWLLDRMDIEYDTIVDIAIIEAFILNPLLEIDDSKENLENISDYAKDALKKLEKGDKNEGNTFIGLINSLVSIEGLSYTFGDCMKMTPNVFMNIWREVDKHFKRLNQKMGSKSSSKGSNISLETPKDYDM